MADRGNIYCVSGVCCSTEEGVLRKQLDAELGPGGYQYNPVTCELRVRDARPDVAQLVRRAGFNAREKQESVRERSFLDRHREAVGPAVASVLLIAGLVLQAAAMEDGSILLFAVAIVVGGWRVFWRSAIALRSRTLDMNVLMSAAVVGAAAIGKWGEGAAVVVLFGISLMLENYSTARTRRAVRSLLAASPEQASVLRGGVEILSAASEVQPGERVMVRPGERIPLDGTVVEGASSVNEAPITGESVPVAKSRGARVFAGSFNERGALTVEVTHGYRDTTLARIVQLIEEAQQQRAPVQSFVERFAHVYTPSVFGVALLVAVVPPLLGAGTYGDWLYRSLVLLVIACPCALVISTPVTLVSALTNAARRGILIKGGKHLEELSSVSAVAFDKTGTLTEGSPRVTDILSLNSMGPEEVLKIVAAIELRSEHHLAAAVLEEAQRRNADYSDLPVEHFEAIPGVGVRAEVRGRTYTLGNERLSESEAWNSPAVADHVGRFRREGKTTMILGSESGPLGILALRDTVREQSRVAIESLRRGGIRHIRLLSGDHEHAVRGLAKELGIEEVNAGLLPEEKVDAVKQMRARHGAVAMVGDGVNDAPALAAASVGIAMGVAGSDATLETADVVLMSDDLSRLPHLFALSTMTLKVIRQNITLALCIKLVFLVLSVAGVSTLWMALLADDGATLAVILNGLRVLTFEESS